MINYSVYMKSNPLDETAAPRAYAKAQMRKNVTFDKFIAHVVAHGSTYSEGIIYGVVSDICSCIVELLLNGDKVQLGKLGNFWISLSCEGTETMAEFTSKHIKEVNIVFTPGEKFGNLINDAEFNPVASRVAQTATLKAEKSNSDTVDLKAAREAAKRNTSDDADNPDTGSDNTGQDSGTPGLE